MASFQARPDAVTRWAGKDGANEMRKVLAALLVTTMTVTGCGTVRDSRLNPFNWFGGSRDVAASPAGATANPLIPARGLTSRAEVVYKGQTVEQITDLAVDRMTNGAIIRAKGLAQRSDAFNLRLVRDETAPAGTLSYALQAEYPPASRTTIRRPREVIVALHLTEQDLEGVRMIRVTGLTNARESRR